MSEAYFLRHPWRSLFGTLSVLALLAACAQLPSDAGKPVVKPSGPLVFPSPPETARFYYERTIRGSADIAAAKELSKLEQWVSGVDPVDNFPLIKPYAIAVHQGRIFISDTAKHIVQVFDVPAARHFLIGEDDPGMLGKPLGLDVDGAGNLYVADGTRKVVQVYSRDGKFLRTLGTPPDFDRLASVAVDHQGARVYAVDAGGVESRRHRIVVFNAHTGEHLYDIGKRGSDKGEFNLPNDASIGKDGLLYVVDGGNFRVQVLDTEGKYIRHFGQLGSQFGNFARPSCIAIDPDGNTYVTDAVFGNFQIFNSNNQLLLFIGQHSEADGPGRYMLPAGIAVDDDGRVYVVDQWFSKVDVYRPAALGAQEGFLVRKAPASADTGEQKKK